MLNELNTILAELKSSGQLGVAITIHQLKTEISYTENEQGTGADVALELALCHQTIDMLNQCLEIGIKQLDTSKNLDYIFDQLYSLDNQRYYDILSELSEDNIVIADIMPDINGLLKCLEADQLTEAKKFEDSARAQVNAKLDILVRIAGKGNNNTELTQISGTLGIKEISDAMRKHQHENIAAWTEFSMEGMFSNKPSEKEVNVENQDSEQKPELSGIPSLKARIHEINESFHGKVESKKTKTSLDIAIEQAIND